MVVRALAERPMIPPVAGLDRQIVDAGNAKPHQPFVVELPVLVAVTSKPAAAVVVPFIGEAQASATLAGSRLFQASSAIRAFCAAVSAVKGGNGGRLTGWLHILYFARGLIICG